MPEINEFTKQVVPNAYFNTQLLFEYQRSLKENPTVSIKDFHSLFLKNLNFDELNTYSTINIGTITMALYAFLLVPKDIWENAFSDFEFNSLDKFLIIIGDKTKSDFIRKLRNSIAHANYKYNKTENTFTFWNENPRKKLLTLRLKSLFLTL